jgi:hypothetical protein
LLQAPPVRPATIALEELRRLSYARVRRGHFAVPLPLLRRARIAVLEISAAGARPSRQRARAARGSTAPLPPRHPRASRASSARTASAGAPRPSRAASRARSAPRTRRRPRERPAARATTARAPARRRIRARRARGRARRPRAPHVQRGPQPLLVRPARSVATASVAPRWLYRAVLRGSIAPLAAARRPRRLVRREITAQRAAQARIRRLSARARAPAPQAASVLPRRHPARVPRARSARRAPGAPRSLRPAPPLGTGVRSAHPALALPPAVLGPGVRDLAPRATRARCARGPARPRPATTAPLRARVRSECSAARDTRARQWARPCSGE